MCINGVCTCPTTQTQSGTQCLTINLVPQSINQPCSGQMLCITNAACQSGRCQCLPGTTYSAVANQCRPITTVPSKYLKRSLKSMALRMLLQLRHANTMSLSNLSCRCGKPRASVQSGRPRVSRRITVPRRSLRLPQWAGRLQRTMRPISTER